MFLKPCFYMVIIHSQVVERLVSDIIAISFNHWPSSSSLVKFHDSVVNPYI